MSCWESRTSHETVLILVLIVSVSFLIGMITLYIVIPRTKVDSIHCPTFCEKHNVYVVNRNKSSKSGIQRKIQNVNDSLDKQDDLCDAHSCENMYPFLLALLDYKYDDDLYEQKFLGSGVLVTQKWALTTSTIVKHVSKIQVRITSSYWSTGGLTSDVNKIILADDFSTGTLAALRLTTPLPSSAIPVKLSLGKVYTNNAMYPIYGWNVNYSLALRFRRKYASSIKVYVTAFDNDVCPELTTGPNQFCARPLYSTIYQPCYYEIGFALLDRYDTLLGIKSGEICRKSQSVHLYHNIANYVKWIKNVTSF